MWIYIHIIRLPPPPTKISLATNPLQPQGKKSTTDLPDLPGQETGSDEAD